MRKSQLVVMAALAIATAAAFASSAAAATPVRPKAASTARAVPMLLVLDAAAGSLRRVGADRYTLTLTSTRRRTTAFTDQPMRVAQTVPTQALGLLWKYYFRDGQKPNAALNLFARDTKSFDTVVLELGTPKVKGATVTFPARILKSAAGRLASFNGRQRTTVPATFSDVSLFIDDGTACYAENRAGNGDDMILADGVSCTVALDVLAAWLSCECSLVGQFDVDGTTWKYFALPEFADGIDEYTTFTATDGSGSLAFAQE